MDNVLGDYLRARRDRVRPEDVGLIAGERRRVPGLRREELAMLAGISSDYYLRLEQGRDQHPSAHVVDALAKALQLDAQATAHLHTLARPKRRTRPRTERVPEGIMLLLAQLPMPAYVIGRYMDVLASNQLARALSPGLAPGHNALLQLFLDPSTRELYLDWDRATVSVVGGLRAAAAADPEDPRFAAIVGELSIRSERFRTLWARADVGYRRNSTSHIRHPQVGEIHMRREKLEIYGSDGLQLVIHHAEPGSDSARALDLLGSIAVTEDAEQPASGSDSLRQ